jgi:hypothetical protein
MSRKGNQYTLIFKQDIRELTFLKALLLQKPDCNITTIPLNLVNILVPFPIGPSIKLLVAVFDTTRERCCESHHAFPIVL